MKLNRLNRQKSNMEKEELIKEIGEWRNSHILILKTARECGMISNLLYGLLMNSLEILNWNLEGKTSHEVFEEKRKEAKHE